MASVCRFRHPKAARQPVSSRESGLAIGHATELRARRLLERAGLCWIASNVRFRGGELDLIMRDAATIVFIEVRYRQRPFFGTGAETVDASKQHKLIRCAHLWLARHAHWADQPCRFDVVHAKGKPPCIHWIRHAFTADT